VSERTKFTAEEKLKFVLKYSRSKLNLSEFCRTYNVDITAMIRWKIKYENSGFEGLLEITTKTVYSSETLINSVRDYLENDMSMIKIVKKYNLSGDSVLRAWLKWYNTPKWNKKIGEFMAREKISAEQKEIYVLEYLDKIKSAEKIAAETGVTASQVRDWARKYRLDGQTALEDNRGRKKDQEELTEEEKLKIEYRKLEEKITRLEAELELRKKLDAMM